MARRHIVPFGSGWAVKVPHRAAPLSVHRTQANAQRAATKSLQHGAGGEVVIHNRQGVIRNSNTINRHDPCPPRDTRH